MSRIRIILTGLVMLAVLAAGLWQGYKWGLMRIYVPHDMALIVINKYGDPLPPGLVAVPADGYGKYKGVREEVLGPGRYFIDPIMYDTKLVPLVQIPAGEPHRWTWTPEGELMDTRSTAPMVGLVSARQGKTPPPGHEVVEEGYKGIQREVLTPGIYKINPMLFEVTLEPATVIPPGSVGVITRLYGDRGEVYSASLTEIVAAVDESADQIEQADPETAARARAAAADDPAAPSRLVAGENQRGIVRDVLQPGIYYLNPRMYKVDVVPIGYDEITLEYPTAQITFNSKDGYLVEADFTVVWGRTPADAPHIIANIGDIDLVRDNVLEPAMKATCQNEGAKYTARELIQGETRSQFQDDLAESLERQVASRNIHVLLALIRNVTIRDAAGVDATEGLLATIQRANIEVERELTNQQKTETAMVKAQLEEALKRVDLAREMVHSDTSVQVAQILADGRKQAAEIEAQRDLEVASIELEIAQLEAQRIQILGKATADVERMKNEAEAQGAKMLIDAFGSPQSYNMYIFARNFHPTDLRLIFAGPGTFWTDLKSFEQVGASQLLQQTQQKE